MAGAKNPLSHEELQIEIDSDDNQHSIALSCKAHSFTKLKRDQSVRGCLSVKYWQSSEFRYITHQGTSLNKVCAKGDEKERTPSSGNVSVECSIAEWNGQWKARKASQAAVVLENLKTRSIRCRMWRLWHDVFNAASQWQCNSSLWSVSAPIGSAVRPSARTLSKTGLASFYTTTTTARWFATTLHCTLN